MKKIVIVIVGILLIIPIKTKAININATSSILMDMDSNRILYSNNINEVRSVASISKIMTAILAIESNKLNNDVIIGEEINEAYGSAIYIKVGEKMKLKDLVYGLMLRSGNDAALSISVNVSKNPKTFVELMNKKAKEIGMKNTTFNNPSGLDEEKGNYSTAYDMALLMSYAYKNKEFKKIIGTKKYILKTNMNTYVWHNKNKLLKMYKYATGGKTGYTKKAKRTLVTTASKDNFNLVAVTLNDGNDFNDHKELFEYGFNNYKNYKLLNKKTFKVENDNYYKDYDLYIKNDFTYPIDITEEDSVIIKIKLNKKRSIINNSKVGKAIIYLGDTKLHSEDIYVKNKSFNFIEEMKEIIYSIW